MQGLLSKKQVLLELEALQQKETNAKVAAIKEEAAAQKEALDIEERAIIMALGQITDANQYAAAIQKLLTLEQQRDLLAKKAATDEHVASVQEKQDIETTTAKLAQLEHSWTLYFQSMKSNLPTIGQAIRTDLQGTIDQFNTAFSADFAKMVVTGKNFGKDMKQVGDEMAESFISMLVKMLLKWTETQIAMKVLGISTAKSEATAKVGASAAEAGAAMVATWSAAPWPIDMAAPAMGAAAYSDAMSYEGLIALATGGVVTQPTMAMFGEQGDEAVLPLTDPQAMERISNALLSSPTMRIAGAAITSPTTIAAASNLSQGGFDDAALDRLGDKVGGHLDKSGGSDIHHHTHLNVKGMISPDNLNKVMKKMSQRVQNRQSNLHSSNTLRVTRRSQ